jgi:predicted DNA-binding protein
MDTISLKLPVVLRQRIAAEARRRNVSQSTIVRESIERQLADSNGARGQVSCADLAGELIGSVRSGRRDLSTNKALLAEAIIGNAQRGRKRRR